MVKRLHLKFVDTLSGRSQLTVAAISTLILVLICWLDCITGDYSLIIFYLIPVSLTAWFINKPTGLLFCFLSLLARVAADSVSTPATRHSNLHHWNLFIEFSFLLIMSLLFSALKKNLDNEKTLARIDPLTKAINRRSFFDLAEQEISRARRYDRPFTIAYIDLDNFKQVNDRLGHHTGDELLMTVVSTIASRIRNTDILARFGGDEFVILLPETAGEAAGSSLDKIRQQLQEAMSACSWPVTFSIGAISYIHAPDSVDDAVRAADALMYEVKRSGKNRLLHVTAGQQRPGNVTEALHGTRRV